MIITYIPRIMYTVAVFFFFGVNTLRSKQNDRHFADDIFKYIFLNEDIWISIDISLNFVPNGHFNNIPAMVQCLAPTRWQAIIWTNDGKFTEAYMRHSASMSWSKVFVWFMWFIYPQILSVTSPASVDFANIFKITSRTFGHHSTNNIEIALKSTARQQTTTKCNTARIMRKIIEMYLRKFELRGLWQGICWFIYVWDLF